MMTNAENVEKGLAMDALTVKSYYPSCMSAWHIVTAVIIKH